MPKAQIENERGQKVRLVQIDCPEEVFDVAGASIMRRKRVAVWRVDEIKNQKTSEDAYKLIAELIPRWDGVVDVDTGEPLPNPEDDPTVFSKLDMLEQFKWIVESVQKNPKN